MSIIEKNFRIRNFIMKNIGLFWHWFLVFFYEKNIYSIDFEKKFFFLNFFLFAVQLSLYIVLRCYKSFCREKIMQWRCFKIHNTYKWANMDLSDKENHLYPSISKNLLKIIYEENIVCFDQKIAFFENVFFCKKNTNRAVICILYSN